MTKHRKKREPNKPRDFREILDFTAPDLVRLLGLSNSSVRKAFYERRGQPEKAKYLCHILRVRRPELTQYLISEGRWDKLALLGWKPEWLLASPSVDRLTRVREHAQQRLPDVRLAYCTTLPEVDQLLHQGCPAGLVLDYAFGREPCQVLLRYLKVSRPELRLIPLVPADEWDRPDRSDVWAPGALAEPVPHEEIVAVIMEEMKRGQE